jgi:predicted lipoprotein with Yx(FWY)xxD motif
MDTSLHSLGISAHRHGEGRITFTNRIALLVVALLLGLTGIVLASPAGAASTSTSTSTSTGTVISEVNSPYGKVLMVGSGQFAGYTLYQFSRNTPAACSATVETVGGMPLSCAGPETDKTADWPALTTVGKPVAGPGVNKSLLGLVHRTDIGGDQVTYAGRLLYLFDQAPHQFSGVNFMETVAPLPPWHGVWYLVSSTNGAPVEGPIALSTEALPSGKSVLAAAMFQGMGGTPITVYTYSKDAKNQSTCTGTCALDWPPVLTTAAPQATAGLTKSSMGTITRPDGTKQLTFDGKPLYLYSKEVPQLNPSTGNPLNPATIGTGNGLAGPAHFGGTFSVVSAPAAAPAA